MMGTRVQRVDDYIAKFADLTSAHRSFQTRTAEWTRPGPGDRHPSARPVPTGGTYPLGVKIPLRVVAFGVALQTRNSDGMTYRA
jgi:hypothetical protein